MTQRARSDADKRSRHDDIVDAARAVFDDLEIDGFTMDAVAASLSLAKGTLYRYVPTREALLLALTIDEYATWFDRVDAALAGATPPKGDTPRDSARDAAGDAETLTSAVVTSLVEQPRLLRLMSLVASVLERNVPFDTALHYKSFLVQRSAVTGTLVARRLGCTQQRALQFLVHLQALTIGLYHHAHPAPVVKEVLVDSAFAALQIDFRRELEHGMRALALAAMADRTPAAAARSIRPAASNDR